MTNKSKAIGYLVTLPRISQSEFHLLYNLVTIGQLRDSVYRRWAGLSLTDPFTF